MLACGDSNPCPYVERHRFGETEKIILFPWNVITLECKKNYFGPRVFEAQAGFLLRVPLKNIWQHIWPIHIAEDGCDLLRSSPALLQQSAQANRTGCPARF